MSARARSAVKTISCAVMCAALFAGLAPRVVIAASTYPGFVADLDCSDFGTRERAQTEMDKYSYDRFGLDRDGDGQACEWNPSTKGWSIALGGLGLIVGRYFGKRKRNGPESVVPGIKGLFFEWERQLESDVARGKPRGQSLDDLSVFFAFLGWAPWLPIVFLRDSVLPISTPPAALLAMVVALGGGVTYWIASTKEDWI